VIAYSNHAKSTLITLRQLALFVPALMRGYIGFSLCQNNHMHVQCASMTVSVCVHMCAKMGEYVRVCVGSGGQGAKGVCVCVCVCVYVCACVLCCCPHINVGVYYCMLARKRGNECTLKTLEHRRKKTTTQNTEISGRQPFIRKWWNKKVNNHQNVVRIHTLITHLDSNQQYMHVNSHVCNSSSVPVANSCARQDWNQQPFRR
jgi:hypothetical protein